MLLICNDGIRTPATTSWPPSSASWSLNQAASVRIAEQYIQAFSLLAKESNTMLLPSDAGNPGAMIAQSLQIFKHTCRSNLTVPGGHQRAAEEVLASDLGVTYLGNILPNQK